MPMDVLVSNVNIQQQHIFTDICFKFKWVKSHDFMITNCQLSQYHYCCVCVSVSASEYASKDWTITVTSTHFHANDIRTNTYLSLHSLAFCSVSERALQHFKRKIVEIIWSLRMRKRARATEIDIWCKSECINMVKRFKWYHTISIRWS